MNLLTLILADLSLLEKKRKKKEKKKQFEKHWI